MKTKLVVAGVVVAFVLLARNASVVAEDEKAPQDPKAAAEMEAWIKAATPGAHHAHLNALVGHWNYTAKWRMTPDAEWAPFTGTSDIKWILGGRFLSEHAQGENMGQPFEGFGHTGYDNLKKKYVSTWMDSMGTGMMTSEGTCDASGKIFTYTGSFMDAVTGKNKTIRSVVRVINNEKYVMEMYDKSPDGKEFLMMEISYTRG